MWQESLTQNTDVVVTECQRCFGGSSAERLKLLSVLIRRPGNRASTAPRYSRDVNLPCMVSLAICLPASVGLLARRVKIQAFITSLALLSSESFKIRTSSLLLRPAREPSVFGIARPELAIE